MVPIYDDVVYLIDGLSRLTVLDRQGIATCLVDFLYAHPPHAPFVALTSLLGLLLSAGAPWGPYLLNVGWILFVLLLGWVALRPCSPWVKVGVLVAALAAPIFGSVLAEFRPDPIWGLMVGFAVIVSARLDVVGAPPRRVFALGLLFGAAVISKPTAAPASALVLAVAWATQVSLSLLVERAWSVGRFVRVTAWLTLGAACMVTPYLVANGAAILAYILEVMGSGSMWRTQASVWGHISYYLNRGTGTLALGWAWYAALPLFAICAALMARARDWQALPAFAAAIAAVLTAYMIVTVSSNKSLMIGSILYGAILAAVVWCMSYIAIRISLRGRAVLVLGALIFATQWVPRAGTIHLEDPAMAATDEANRAVLPPLVEALRVRPDASVLITVPGPAYAGTLDFLSRQQGIVRTFVAGYTWDSWGRVVRDVSTADVVVLSEAGMTGQSLGYAFPSVQFQSRLLEELRASSEFKGRPVYTDKQQRSVWLFVRNRR